MNDDEHTAGGPRPESVPMQVIEGGRTALEREVLWAVALGRPDADVLLRLLLRPANASLSVVPTSANSSNFAAVTIARNGG